MAIQIVRNDAGNCINFFGSSNPVYFNACLSGRVNPDDSTAVDVVNDIMTAQTGETQFEFYAIPFDQWVDADGNPFASAQAVADYITLNGNVVAVTDVTAGYEGVWDASTNTPDLTGLTPNNGDWFYVSVAGTYNTVDYQVNDVIKYDDNTSAWQHVPNETVRVDTLEQEVSDIVYSTESALFNTNPNVYADGDQAIADPNNLESGWYYKNETSGIGKINWYYVANVNPENAMTVGTLKGMYAVIKVLATGVPFFSVYTQPTGGAADAASWYRSRLTYFTGSALDAYVGQEVLLYWGEDPSDKFQSINHIELSLDASTSLGPAGTDENILFGALSTSSNSPEGTYEFLAKALGYKNNNHIREYQLDTNDPVAAVQTTDVQANTQIDFTRDATNTSVILDHDGSHYGVNTIKAVAEADGTISINGIGDDGEPLVTNIQYDQVTIAGLGYTTITAVVNALNALFTVNPYGVGYEPSVILPVTAATTTTLSLQEGVTPVTGNPVHLYAPGADTSSGHGARAWTTETIDQAGEYFDVKITGGIGRFILGLVDTNNATYMSELTNDSGGGHNGLTWGNAFYDYGSYSAPWTTYGRDAANLGLSYGPGWSFSGNDPMMRYNQEVQDNLDNMDAVLFRVGLSDQGHIYVSYYDAGRTNTFIMTARTSKIAPAGDYALVVKLWSGNTTLVETPKVSLLEPTAPALSFRYIESPDGYYSYPLFATQEEADYYELTESGVDNGSHTHVYPDDPTSTTWYMPNTRFQMNHGLTPVEDGNTTFQGSTINWTEIPSLTNADLVPSAFSGGDFSFNENESVNIQVTPAGASWSTTVAGLPSGLTFDGIHAIQGTTEYVPSDEVHTITVTRTNSYGSSAGTFDLTISDNASLGDLTGFTEVGGNLVQPNRIIRTHDALLQYDTVLSQGQQLTYSYDSVPPTIGILGSTGETNLAAFDPETDSLDVSGSSSNPGFNFAYSSQWDLRYSTFSDDIGRDQERYALTGWADNTTQAGADGDNLNIEFKLEYANDGFIRLYRGGVLKLTSLNTFSGDQTLTLFEASSSAADIYIPSNLSITNIGAGSTTPPAGFTDPVESGEMASTSLFGNGGSGAVLLTETLKVNHRYVIPRSWIEANVLPNISGGAASSSNDKQFLFGVAKSGVDWSTVDVGHLHANFRIEGTSTGNASSLFINGQASGADVVVNSITSAFYDYALEWDGTDLHVIACNVNDINTQPGVSSGGSFSRVATYSNFVGQGFANQELSLAIAVRNDASVTLSTTGLQQIRIPFSPRTVLCGESSSGNGQYGIVDATYFDLGGQHAPGAISFSGITSLDAGQTYTFIYHPSMEAGDFIEFRLASDNTTVYSTGVTAFDSTTNADPSYDGAQGYKGLTFAVPADAPPLRLYHYNSYQSGYYDAGRPIAIAGSTYTEDITGITLEGPAANQTGSNVANNGSYGWLSIDETLSAGERFVMSNDFLTDLLAEMGDQYEIRIGLKGDNWDNTDQSTQTNSVVTGEVFKGNIQLRISKSSSNNIYFQIFHDGIGGSNSMLVNTTSLHETTCAFIEITNSGDNIRMGFGRNGQYGVAAGSEVTTTWADWASYKGQTGAQGYGIASLDVVFLVTDIFNGNGDNYDGGNVDWTHLSEVSVPAPAETNDTTWTKALDFSGSSERAEQVSTDSNRIPMRMGGTGQTVAQNGGLTAGYPWATACVFKIDGHNSNQHIWNVGEGAGSTDDNIALRVDASGALYFEWGRDGARNSYLIATNLGSAAWYGVTIAHKGMRFSGSDATNANLSSVFAIDLWYNSGGNWIKNPNTPPGTRTWTATGGRMDRSFTGSLTIGGRGGNRNFHGKVASFVTTTLKINEDLPSTDELKEMLTDPMGWLTSYKVGNAFRLPWQSADAGFNFALNDGSSAYSTQVWLMGDGTSDSYSNMIRNQVQPSDQNYTKLNLISMVSSDIETVSIPGLT